MTDSPLRIIVAAGGTGGDLFPAVAVVEEIQKIRAAEVVLFGNPHRMEARVAPQLGYVFEPLSVRGFKGVRSLQSYALPFTILHSTMRVIARIRSWKPQVVICAGTYISFPVALAASVCSVPVVCIESNALPGKANRRVADRASLIIAAFEECQRYLSPAAARKVRVLGNPIRGSLTKLPDRAAGAAVFGLDPSKPTLLVFGGSLGARSINTIVESSVHLFEREGIQVLWQTGTSYTAPADLPCHIRSVPFINDMASAYAACDMVVCRSGGGTVAELATVAKPAILVPYPHAANNEQEHNARALEERGGAVMIRDAELAEKLVPEVLRLMRDTGCRTTMSSALHAMARPDAARDAARLILELIATTRPS